MLEAKKRFNNKSLLGFCFLFCFVISILFFAVSPPTTAPDEIAHLAYPRQILLSHQLPSFLSSQNYWESHQPPLYYLLSVPIVKLTSNLNFSAQVYYNRFLSLLLFWGSLFIFFLGVRKLFKEEIWKQISSLFLFTFPMVLYSASSFSNDSLVLFMSVLCFTVLFFPPKKTYRNAIFLGFLFGASLLTKIDLYPVVFLTFLAIFFATPWKQRIIMGFVTFITSIWWFIHNSISGSGFFGLKFTFILWNQKADFSKIGTWITLVKKLFSGFIGIFGKYNIAFPSLIYFIIAILFAVALYFGIRTWGLKSKKGRLSLCIIGAVLIFVLFQNIQFFQPQGRYLISIIPFVVILIMMSVTNSKIFRGSVICLLTFIIVLNFSSLYLINSYYKKNPIESFKHYRAITIYPKDWNGDRSKISTRDAQLTVNPPAQLFTLKDLRLLTSDKPTLHLLINSISPIHYKVYWKVLGQTAFTKNRMIEQSGMGEQVIQFPEALQTIIQDVKLEFTNNQPSFTIQSCSVTTS